MQLHFISFYACIITIIKTLWKVKIKKTDASQLVVQMFLQLNLQRWQIDF